MRLFTRKTKLLRLVLRYTGCLICFKSSCSENVTLVTKQCRFSDVIILRFLDSFYSHYFLEAVGKVVSRVTTSSLTMTDFFKVTAT